MSESDQPPDDPPDRPAPPVPVADVIGRPADEVAQLHRDPGRIRLYARNGIVEHPSHG